MGQSWGTALGMRLAARRPDLVAAYVGVNQVVDRGAEELRAYRACLQRARERGNAKAVAQLEALGEPKDGAFASVEGTLVQRRWMRTLGMVTFEPKRAAEIGRAIAMNPELTLRDLLNLFAHVRWNMELLWPEFCRVDLAREIPAVDAPVFFVAGEHDRLTSPELARQYLDALRAPRKEFVLFPRSGHVACFEEPPRLLEADPGDAGRTRNRHGARRHYPLTSNMAAHRIVPPIWLDDQAEPARDRVFQALLPVRRLDLAELGRAVPGTPA